MGQERLIVDAGERLPDQFGLNVARYEPSGLDDPTDGAAS